MGNLPVYLLKVTTLLCAAILTLYSLNHAIKRDFYNNHPLPCLYSSHDRNGELPESMQEDPNIKREELAQFGKNFFKGPYAPSEWLLNLKSNKLYLESKAKEGRLRLIDITTSDGRNFGIYLPDGQKCSSEDAGDIIENGSSISSVKVLTLKGAAP